MLKTAVIIILSFFAVIGFIECILSLLETVSTSRYKKIKDIALVVELSGAVENVTFLLNTLLLQGSVSAIAMWLHGLLYVTAGLTRIHIRRYIVFARKMII